MKKPLRYCPNFSKSLHNIDIENRLTEIVRTRCKQWSCDYCAPINRRVWLARIGIETEKDTRFKQWYFFTFTLLGKDHRRGIAHSLRVWRDNWNNFATRLRQKFGTSRYIRVFEPHKDNTLHIHMLTDMYIDDIEIITDKNTSRGFRYESATVRDLLVKNGFGYIHDLMPIEHRSPETKYSSAVAGYVGKYLTKDMQAPIRDELKSAGMGRVRLIQTSRGWAKLDNLSDGKNWRLGGITFNEFLKMVDDEIEVYDLQLRHYLDHSDFENSLEYPPQAVDKD